VAAQYGKERVGLFLLGRAPLVVQKGADEKEETARVRQLIGRGDGGGKTPLDHCDAAAKGGTPTPQLRSKLLAILGGEEGENGAEEDGSKPDPDAIVLPTDWAKGIFKGAWGGKGSKSKKRAMETMNLPKGKALVNELYVAKIKADAKDRTDKSSPELMKEFTMQFLYFKYGTPKLVQSRLGGIIKSFEEHLKLARKAREAKEEEDGGESALDALARGGYLRSGGGGRDEWMVCFARMNELRQPFYSVEAQQLFMHGVARFNKLRDAAPMNTKNQHPLGSMPVIPAKADLVKLLQLVGQSPAQVSLLRPDQQMAKFSGHNFS
jgi:hypothetical protein